LGGRAQLGRRCVLFALEHYEAMVAPGAPPGFPALLQRMVPKLRESLKEQLLKKQTAPSV
jgi:hypothetical protein